MRRILLPDATRSQTSRRTLRPGLRRGVIALEELLTLAVMLPLAFAIFFFTWSMSSMVYGIIRTMVLVPIL